MPALRYRQITSPASDSGGAARLPLCSKVLVARTFAFRDAAAISPFKRNEEACASGKAEVIPLSLPSMSVNRAIS